MLSNQRGALLSQHCQQKIRRYAHSHAQAHPHPLSHRRSSFTSTSTSTFTSTTQLTSPRGIAFSSTSGVTNPSFQFQQQCRYWYQYHTATRDKLLALSTPPTLLTPFTPSSTYSAYACATAAGIVAVGVGTVADNGTGTGTGDTLCEASESTTIDGEHQKSLEEEWENFMIRSMNPNDDDDDDDDEEEEEEDEDNEEGQEDAADETSGTNGDCDDGGDDDGDDDEIEGAVDESALESEESSNGNEDKGDLNDDVNNNSSNSNNIDPYDNLPEEDEPTTCTICLINRQGPCRPPWRRFERCMKDNSSDDDNNNNDGEQSSSSSKSSMAEMCDQYMIPWIGCIQNYRNTYTSISNAFFQKELISEIESSISDDEKVLLEDIDISSIIHIDEEWWTTNEDNKNNNNNNDNNNSSSSQEGEGEEDYVIVQDAGKDDSEGDNNDHEDKDIVLVEGAARINLYDGDKPVNIAFVKDQDGNLLGFDQFTDFKKSLDAPRNENENENEDDAASATTSNFPTVGQCKFHVDPKSTKSIQIYALYRSLGEGMEEASASTSDGPETEEAAQVQVPSEVQTLYISSSVLMSDLPKPNYGTSSSEETEQVI